MIDLKTDRITHQDVGQMDMYVRMYDDLKRGEGDNPTLGIVLCTDTSEDLARYSVLHDNGHLFAAKYKLYLPTEDELRAEIEHQKAMFALQRGIGDSDAGLVKLADNEPVAEAAEASETATATADAVAETSETATAPVEAATMDADEPAADATAAQPDDSEKSDD